jgi:NTE family protein
MRMLNLALQGGGSHGAFTWGVLDALLDDGRISFEGLSGTSAGAVNAVALASGWATAEAAGRDPREGARETLNACWTRVSGWGSLGALQQQFLKLLWGGLPQLSPYQANPLGLNPLRDLLEASIDFEAIAKHRALKVFVSATHVTTGKAVVFAGGKLDAQAVLASACLPTLFQAVEIDGEAYWDGGYSVNPALSPLTTECRTADMMLVQINAVARPHAPRTTAAIQDRISELTFNASLLTQMRAIDFINRLVAEGAVSDPGCKAVRVHRIDGGPGMEEFSAASRGSPDAAMIGRLFRMGRESAGAWLQKHFAAIGHHGTVDIRRDYLDDTRLELPTPSPSPVRRVGGPGFKPWLARLLRRRRAD